MELFDYFLRQTGCTFISDLPSHLDLNTIVEICEGIDLYRFSLREWNDVLNYLLDDDAFQIQTSMDGISRFLQQH